MAIEYIATAVLGIITSIVAWYLIVYVLSPKLKFSAKVSVKDVPENEEPGGKAYRAKFENAGHRAITDLRVDVRLRIPGLHPETGNWEVTYVPTTFSGTPYTLPVPEEGGRRFVSIRITKYKREEFTRNIYPKYIRDKAKSDTLTLEDLLSIKETDKEATVQLIARGTDSFSGVQKAFTSPRYTKGDIVPRPFKRRSLDIEEDGNHRLGSSTE